MSNKLHNEKFPFSCKINGFYICSKLHIYHFILHNSDKKWRKKHDSRYPFNAIKYVLEEAKLRLNEVDHIVFFEKPFLKFERLLETYMAFAPKGFKSFSLSMPIWLREKLFQKKFLFDKLKEHDKNFNDVSKIKFSEHHYSHAASAFFPSPFEEAIILTLDGVGDWATTTGAVGKKSKLEIKGGKKGIKGGKKGETFLGSFLRVSECRVSAGWERGEARGNTLAWRDVL